MLSLFYTCTYRRCFYLRCDGCLMNWTLLAPQPIRHRGDRQHNSSSCSSGVIDVHYVCLLLLLFFFRHSTYIYVLLWLGVAFTPICPACRWVCTCAVQPTSTFFCFSLFSDAGLMFVFYCNEFVITATRSLSEFHLIRLEYVKDNGYNKIYKELAAMRRNRLAFLARPLVHRRSSTAYLFFRVIVFPVSVLYCIVLQGQKWNKWSRAIRTLLYICSPVVMIARVTVMGHT